MKLLGAILILLILAIIVYLSLLSLSSRRGHAAGLVDAKLTACPLKPNCVSSLNQNDLAHYIEPLPFPANLHIMPILRKAIKEMGGKLVEEDSNYITATFSSSLFGFIDDLECYIDINNNQIHLRSASRVGWSDFGKNRQRVFQLTALLKPQLEGLD